LLLTTKVWLWSNWLAMKEFSISEFKAKCLALLKQVQKTKQPILITRFGRPVAEVVPPSPAARKDWMGSMKDIVEITGDFVSPATEERDWEALRD
jgi:prevent-host-death family protein